MIQQTTMIRTAEVWSKDGGLDGLSCTSRLSTNVHDGTRTQLVSRVRNELGPVLQLPNDGHGGSPNPGEAMLGIPVVNEDELQAILILDLTCDSEAPGAIEVWCRDERDELGLNGAIFSSLSRFAKISQFVRFPRGSGLPGKCWEDRQVKLVHQLGTSPGFMRAAGARAGGLDVGVAVPVMKSEHDLHSVLLMLSSREVPIARGFEVWDVDADGSKLTRSASAGHVPSIEIDEESITYAPEQGLAGLAWSLGIPVVSENPSEIDSRRAAAFENDGISRAIAFPVYVGKSIRSVLLMLD